MKADPLDEERASARWKGLFEGTTEYFAANGKGVQNEHRETSGRAREKRVRNGAGRSAGANDAAERSIG